MAIDIVVPVLGESITEATIARWLKQPGDRVQVDEPVVELETEKATVELGAPKTGVLSEVLAAERQDVAVGAVIGRVDDAAAGEAEPRPEPERARPPAREAAAAGVGVGAPPEPDPSRIPASGPGGTVTADDLRSALDLPGAGGPRPGPAARKLLADHGLAAAEVAARGPGGRITKGDVLAHLAEGAGRASPPRERRERMSRLRRTLAARLVAAQQTAAILTTFNEIDMGEVLALRERQRADFEKKHGVRLGLTAFFAKAVVSALRQVPEVNAEIDGDEVIYKDHYDLGVAVSAPQGLVVPVIRDCDTRSFAEIESALADLAARARDGKLRPEEMGGGTFTLSNGGVFGSLLSTPILNPPQSGILGLHKIEDRPVARDGQVVIRPMMYVALSYDHRLIDGKGAVTFLVLVKQAIESPERLLLGL